MYSLESIFTEFWKSLCCLENGACPEQMYQTGPGEPDGLRHCVNDMYRQLQQWEQELAHREQAAEKKERDLIAAQQALAAREKELDCRRAALEKAAAGYHRERQQLEACLPARNGFAACTAADLNSVLQGFLSIQAELNRTKGILKKLNYNVVDSQYGGIRRLCALYRDLSISEDERLRRFADHLGMILRFDFSAEPLDPCPGETYDSTIHERLDASRTGARIVCCRARGWRWNGEVILRAVVDTEERNEHQ